jgi:sulfite exporter TauE/SafE
MIDALNAYCSAHPWLIDLSRWLGVAGAAPILFLAGLLGGLTHCAGMCGPFVLAQITADDATLGRGRLSEGRRLVRAFLLPYHLGRFTTYVALGAILGGATGLAVFLSGAHWLPALLLGVAALAFLMQGLSGVVARLGIGLGAGNPLAGPLTRLVRPLLARPDGWRGYALGVALGFLPCGLLWGALGAAAGSGGAVRGASAMAAFVVGTMPSLIAVGHIGVFFRNRAPRAARSIGIPLLLGNAGFLGFLALRALG